VPYTVRYTREALRDLAQMQAYYGRGGPRAERLVGRVRDALIALPDDHYRWPVDDRNPDLRMRIVEGHRIRFRILHELETVLVVRIRGPSQDLD